MITSNCCGMTDLVKDGFNGLLFKPQDSKDLSKKLLTVLQDNKLQEKLGRNAREEIVKNWSWESATNKLLTSSRNLMHKGEKSIYLESAGTTLAVKGPLEIINDILKNPFLKEYIPNLIIVEKPEEFFEV